MYNNMCAVNVWMLIQLVSSNLRHSINRIYAFFVRSDIWLWFEFFGRSFLYLFIDIKAFERNEKYSKIFSVYQFLVNSPKIDAKWKQNIYSTLSTTPKSEPKHSSWECSIYIFFWQPCSKFMIYLAWSEATIVNLD